MQAQALGVPSSVPPPRIRAVAPGLQLAGRGQARLFARRMGEDLRPEAESQTRALLQFPECRINTAVPGAFAHLAAVADKLSASRKPDEAPRDGLGCVIKMRNDVMHPTRTKRTKWSFYQWTEAHSLAVHFLELALLAYVGYRGGIIPDRGQPLARIRRRCPPDWLLKSIGQAHHPHLKGNPKCSQVKPEHYQQGSRTVSAALAGLRWQLAYCVPPGIHTFAVDGIASPRHASDALGHGGLDLCIATVAPCLLGCPGTRRQHPVSAARRGYGRPDRMAGSGMYRHHLAAAQGEKSN